MSDVNIEQNKHDLLRKMLKDLFITVLFACIGWIIFTGLAGSGPFAGAIMILGVIVITLPLLKKMIKDGQSPFGFFREYTVVTTWSDGSKTSDGGAQATQMNLVMLALTIILGTIITLIKIFYLTIRFFITYLSMKSKPAFMKSCFPVLVIWLFGLISLIMGPSIGGNRMMAEMVSEIAEHDRLNAEAVTYKLNGVPENGYSVKLDEIFYRSDFTVIRIFETKEGAIMPFLFSDGADTRFSGGRMTTSFDVQTASGDNFSSVDYRGHSDSKTGKYIGIDVFFPKEFTESEFNLVETSSAPSDREKLIVFRNVKVSKQ